jgi:hypothetical protein
MMYGAGHPTPAPYGGRPSIASSRGAPANLFTNSPTKGEYCPLPETPCPQRGLPVDLAGALRCKPSRPGSFLTGLPKWDEGP